MALMSWLKKEDELIYGLAVGSIILDFGCNIAALKIFELMGINIPKVPTEAMTIDWALPIILLFAALAEELIFRFLPLAIAVECGWSDYKIVIVSILSSIVFGYLHGGITHVFIQGVSGLIFSLLFLKAGGLREKYFEALVTTTVVHFCFNCLVAITLLLQGKTII